MSREGNSTEDKQEGEWVEREKATRERDSHLGLDHVEDFLHGLRSLSLSFVPRSRPWQASGGYAHRSCPSILEALS